MRENSEEGIVFLPGMMCDERLFEPQLRHLKDRVPFCVADLSGHDTIEAISEYVLNEVPFDQFSVAGLSMGGIVAMELMRCAPERIGRVLLMDTNHRADAAEKRAIRERQIWQAQTGLLKEIIVGDMKPAYLAQSNRKDSRLLELLVTMALDLGEEAFVRQSKALMTRRDYGDVLRQWKKPVTLLCGEEDTLCPPERHAEMAKLLNQSDLYVLADTGHISSLESPDRVNQLIEKCLISNQE